MSNFNPTNLGIRLRKNFARKQAQTASISVNRDGLTSNGTQRYSLRTNLAGRVSEFRTTNVDNITRQYHRQVAKAMTSGFSPIA